MQTLTQFTAEDAFEFSADGDPALIHSAEAKQLSGEITRAAIDASAAKYRAEDADRTAEAAMTIANETSKFIEKLIWNIVQLEKRIEKLEQG